MIFHKLLPDPVAVDAATGLGCPRRPPAPRPSGGRGRGGSRPRRARPRSAPARAEDAAGVQKQAAVGTVAEELAQEHTYRFLESSLS